MEEADEIMQNIDLLDSVFIACAIATNSEGVFSEDKHFGKQKRVRVFKTKDLLEFL